MSRPALQAFGYLAAGVVAGAVCFKAASFLLKPSYEQAVYTQMVAAFRDAAARQEAERLKLEALRKVAEAQEREHAQEMLVILRAQLAVTNPLAESFSVFPPAVQGRCFDELRVYETFSALNRQLAGFDEEVERRQRTGPVLRSAEERSNHARLLQEQKQAISLRCGMLPN